MKIKNLLIFLGLILSFFLVLIAALIALYFIYGKPWDRALFISPLYKLPTQNKVVALTFDDGPSPVRTPALLDLLDKYQVKASFFLLGEKIEQYPEITADIIARGHLAANHSYSHPRLIFKSPIFMRDEIVKTNNLLKSAGSDHWQYFRPPNTNKLIILPLVLNSLDMKLVTGSYDPNSQYQKPFPADQVSSEVISNIEPGAIIYLHDGRDDSAEEFVKAVETIIFELEKNEYKFVTIEYSED